MRELLKLLPGQISDQSKGVQLIWSILYKPETNSVAKRAVRTVKDWIIKNAQ